MNSDKERVIRQLRESILWLKDLGFTCSSILFLAKGYCEKYIKGDE